MILSLAFGFLCLESFAAALVLTPTDGSINIGGKQGQLAALDLNKMFEKATQMHAFGNGMSLLGAARSHAIMDVPGPLEAQTRLMTSQLRFNQASKIGRNAREQAIEKNITQALKSPTAVRAPKLEVGDDVELTCLADVNRCPKGWQRQGRLCVAMQGYTGPCTSSTSLFDMNVQERLAFARYCQVEFHCQENCIQNFGAVCPSLWQQVGASVCAAPSNYVGECAHRVHTKEMTNQDKLDFGLKCGSRWPCTAPPDHQYSDVCPEGWTMHYGETCTAPMEYRGSCGKFVRMRGLGKREKQILEAECGVSWPSAGFACERDYAAPCPYGWRQRATRGKIECIAPPTYNGCSPVQSFHDVSPVGKQKWEQNCGQRFPCLGEILDSIQNPPTAVKNGPVA